MRWDREIAELRLKKMGCRLRVKHLHQGNSSNNQRHGKPYVTVARIINSAGSVVVRSTATCSKKDSPSRSLGRTIATDRALYSFMSYGTI